MHGPINKVGKRVMQNTLTALYFQVYSLNLDGYEQIQPCPISQRN